DNRFVVSLNAGHYYCGFKHIGHIGHISLLS
ncbi:MAG: hypothetical protein ACI956_001629, partial [Nonlabens sp.]